jgi:hypothetical protein
MALYAAFIPPVAYGGRSLAIDAAFSVDVWRQKCRRQAVQPNNLSSRSVSQLVQSASIHFDWRRLWSFHWPLLGILGEDRVARQVRVVDRHA